MMDINSPSSLPHRNSSSSSSSPKTSPPKPTLSPTSSRMVLNAWADESYESGIYNQKSLLKLQEKAYWAEHFICKIFEELRSLFENHNKLTKNYFEKEITQYAVSISQKSEDELQDLLDEYQRLAKNPSENGQAILLEKITKQIPNELSNILFEFTKDPNFSNYRKLSEEYYGYRLKKFHAELKDKYAKMTESIEKKGKKEPLPILQVLLDWKIERVQIHAFLSFKCKVAISEKALSTFNDFLENNHLYQEAEIFLKKMTSDCENEITKMKKPLDKYAKKKKSNFDKTLDQEFSEQGGGFHKKNQLDYDLILSFSQTIDAMQREFSKGHRERKKPDANFCRLFMQTRAIDLTGEESPNYNSIIQKACNIAKDCFGFNPFQFKLDQFDQVTNDYHFLETYPYTFHEIKMSNLDLEECHKRIVKAHELAKETAAIKKKTYEAAIDACNRDLRADQQKVEGITNYMRRPEDSIWDILRTPEIEPGVEPEIEFEKLEKHLSIINKVDRATGCTPLHLATWMQRINCIRKLLELGASPFLQTKENVLYFPKKPSRTISSFDLAAALSNFEIIELFIEKSYKPLMGTLSLNSSILQNVIDPYLIITPSPEEKISIDEQWRENAGKCLSLLQKYVKDLGTVPDILLKKLQEEVSNGTQKDIVFTQSIYNKMINVFLADPKKIDSSRAELNKKYTDFIQKLFPIPESKNETQERGKPVLSKLNFHALKSNSPSPRDHKTPEKLSSPPSSSLRKMPHCPLVPGPGQLPNRTVASTPLPPTSLSTPASPRGRTSVSLPESPRSLPTSPRRFTAPTTPISSFTSPLRTRPTPHNKDS